MKVGTPMLLLGIDIGTSACKATLFGTDGTVISTSTGSYPICYPSPRHVEQDPEDWWSQVCACTNDLLSKSGASPSDIAAIGIAGQSWSAIPIDEDGNVLCNTPIWLDSRSEGVCREVTEQIGEKRLFQVSGNPFSPNYTLPKLLYWMKTQPSLVRKAQKFLQSNSFIAYRLTGTIAQDISMMYGWQNFDFDTLRFDRELTNELGVDPRFLIEPVECDTVIGRVTAQASKLCGLAEGTPVVAGGLDAACGSLGAGVFLPGQTQEQGGQAGGMSICLDHPLKHEKLILGAHVVPKMYLLQGGTAAGGASLKWFAHTLGAAGSEPGRLVREGADVFELLSREAEASQPGAEGLIFLPYLSGERSPVWDSKAQGVFFGIRLDTEHRDMVRAVMEGVAFALWHNILTAKETGADVRELRSVGGSANSLIWTQIKSDVTGIRMVVPDAADTATTRGAAILAGVGVGVYRDYAEAVRTTVKISRVQEPDMDANRIYAGYFSVYRQLYEANKGLMHALSDLKEEKK